jgi:hypothetical protein
MRTLRRCLFVSAVGLGLGSALGAMLVASDVGRAEAVGTRTFELDNYEKLSAGELKGTSVSSAGDVEAGWVSTRSTLQKGASIWSALARPDGSVLLGTGPDGRVLKVDAQGHETVVAETGTLAVTAIVEGPGGKIYAATMPEGEIFVIDPTKAVGTNPSAPAAEKPKAWTKLPSDHIWALVFDKKRNELFAGTGPDGKIYRVDAAGKSQVFYGTEDTQIVSLAIAPSGTLYAGTSGKGLLLAISAAGRAEVVQDFNGHEVKAIGFQNAAPAAAPEKGAKVAAPAKPESASGDTLLCIVNEYPSAPEPMKKWGVPTKPPSTGYGPSYASKGKGEVWKVSGLAADGSQGKPERLFRDDGTTFFSMAVPTAPKAGGPIVYVGTAHEGKVLAIDEVHAVNVVAKAESRTIGAIGLAAGEGKGSWFAAGDSAAFHQVTGVGGPEATWTSKVLDASLKARWGKLTWRMTGAVELATRTGNTATPDDSWSPWSAALAAPGKVTSPAGRFVQIRARWKGDGAASVRGISLAFVTDNLRAIVTDVSASKGTAVGATLVGGSTVPSSGTDVPSKNSSVKLTWKTDNPDGDSLRYRLWYRREESPTWRPITKEDEPISATDFAWQTEALAEGWYRVRLEASDEMSNPYGQALKHALDSAPFVVDNTPPVIAPLALNQGKLQGTVTDGVGPIVRLEVQIDGKGPWRPITSADGILDEATEKVDVALGLSGSHVIALRAFDQAGNQVTKEIEGK